MFVYLWFDGTAQVDPIIFICRLVSALFNSFYSFYWDLVQDWGLGRGVFAMSKSSSSLSATSTLHQGSSRRDRNYLVTCGALEESVDASSRSLKAPPFLLRSRLLFANAFLPPITAVSTDQIDSSSFEMKSHPHSPSPPIHVTSSLTGCGGYSIYYLIIAFNLFARFLWLLVFLHFRSTIPRHFEGLLLSLQMLEILRRFLWILLRVERECLMLATK